jgi:hypothetical protein
MHVYRNRRYGEEIVMLIWHKKGEQRMIETHKQKTVFEHGYKHITRSQIAQHRHTHTETNKRLRARDMVQGEIVLRGGVGERLSAPVPDDECGDIIVRAIRHEARSSGLGDGSSDLYPET